MRHLGNDAKGAYRGYMFERYFPSLKVVYLPDKTRLQLFKCAMPLYSLQDCPFATPPQFFPRALADHRHGTRLSSGDEKFGGMRSSGTKAQISHACSHPQAQFDTDYASAIRRNRLLER